MTDMKFFVQSGILVMMLFSMSLGQLAFSESMIDFGRVTTRDGGKAHVYLKNLSEEDIYISAINHYDTHFKVELEQQIIPAGDSLLLTITVHNDRNVDVRDVLVIQLDRDQKTILPMQASFYYFTDDVYSFSGRKYLNKTDK